MTITVEQTAAISAELSVDLATVTDDRLIELCLLYRSAPEALPTFPDLLEVEITRRFTAAEIAANDVMFSVINNFSNNFDPELQYKEKLYQFVNALDRDVWMAENVSFFEATLTVPSRVEWLLNDSVVFNAVFESPLASNKLFNSSVAISAVIASSTAMNAVAASSTAMNAVIASSTAMTAVAASSTAMTAVIASSTAMTAVAASSTALSIFVKSESARTAMMNNDSTYQSVRGLIFQTVTQNWEAQTKRFYGLSNVDNFGNANSDMNTSVGFVFAALGGFDSGNKGVITMRHPNNTIVSATADKNLGNSLSSIVSPISGVSFNGMSLTKVSGTARAVLELWTPPA